MYVSYAISCDVNGIKELLDSVEIVGIQAGVTGTPDNASRGSYQTTVRQHFFCPRGTAFQARTGLLHAQTDQTNIHARLCARVLNRVVMRASSAPWRRPPGTWNLLAVRVKTASDQDGHHITAVDTRKFRLRFDRCSVSGIYRLERDEVIVAKLNSSWFRLRVAWGVSVSRLLLLLVQW